MKERPSFTDLAKCTNCKFMQKKTEGEYCNQRNKLIRQIKIQTHHGEEYMTPEMNCSFIELIREDDTPIVEQKKQQITGMVNLDDVQGNVQRCYDDNPFFFGLAGETVGLSLPIIKVILGP